jgi:hypothetical protein
VSSKIKYYVIKKKFKDTFSNITYPAESGQCWSSYLRYLGTTGGDNPPTKVSFYFTDNDL